MFIIQIFMLKPTYIKYSLISFFILGTLFAIIQLPKMDFRMTRGKNKHLIWYWLDLPIIWLIIGLSYYLIPPLFNKTGELYTFLFTLITVVISLYFYYKYKTWGSMWCYISNLLWIVALVYSIILIKV